MTEPTNAFTYQEREAYMEEQERRREHDARMDKHDAEPLPPIPRMTPEEILRERLIAELEGILEYREFMDDEHDSSSLAVRSYLVETLLTRLKEGEI